MCGQTDTLWNIHSRASTMSCLLSFAYFVCMFALGFVMVGGCKGDMGRYWERNGERNGTGVHGMKVTISKNKKTKQRKKKYIS